MADADLIFQDDNRTIFLRADTLTCQAVATANNTVLRGISVDLGLPSASGVPIAATPSRFGAGLALHGIRPVGNPNIQVSNCGPQVPADPIAALKVDKAIVDLANELRLLHQAILELDARLAKMGG